MERAIAYGGEEGAESIWLNGSKLGDLELLIPA